MHEPMDTPQTAVLATAEQTPSTFNQGQETLPTKQQKELLNVVDSFFDMAPASSSIKVLNFLISCISNPDDPIYYQLEGLTINNSISTVNSLTELIIELQESYLTNQHERLLSCVDAFFDLDRASSYTKTLNFLLLCITDMDEELRNDLGERIISNIHSKINDLVTFLMELQEKNSRLVAAK